jgi:hemolysin activation/secretion protein
MFHKFVARVVSSNRWRALVTVVAATAPICADAADDASALSATVIDGANAYSPTQLFAVYRDQLGRPINATNAREILAQIESLYARDGYSRPEFELNSALVGNGVLRVAVFEAQITEVTFNGDVGPYASTLGRLSDDLRASVPLKASAVRTFMQQARALPGLQVAARTTRDPSRRNAYALIVDADYRALEGVVQITNRGTEAIGPNFMLGQLIGNNILGMEERLGLIFSAALDYEEYHGAGLFFDAPVNQADTRLTTTLFGSRSNPFDSADIEDIYDRERAVVRVSHPVYETALSRLTLSGGMDFDNLEISVRNRLIRDERLRVGEVGTSRRCNSARVSMDWEADWMRSICRTIAAGKTFNCFACNTRNSRESASSGSCGWTCLVSKAVMCCRTPNVTRSAVNVLGGASR